MLTTKVPGRVRAAIAQHLYYKPERASFHRHRVGAWTLSASANTRTWAIATPYSLTKDAFVAVAGVPTLEAMSHIEGSMPEKMAACVRNAGAQYVFEKVGGTFSLGMLDSECVSAFADFSGYNSCFYLITNDYFAVGNLPELVAAFRPGFPDKHEVDTKTLSWVAATTMVIGDQTPFAGVRRLRTGHRIDAKLGERPFSVNGVRVTPFSPMHFDRLAGLDSFESVEFDRHIEAMRTRVRWCRDQGIRFQSHLTGGRDTRAIAAILAGSGHIGAVTEFVTNRSETNGDVMLARELAPALGIADRHTVRPGSKVVEKLGATQFVDALARSAFVFGAQLTPFDGRSRPSSSGGDFATIMGGGGEIYRQEWGPAGILGGPNAVTNALSLFARYDKLDIMSEACRDFHESVVAQELGYLKDLGAVNLTCAYYLEERLANWGCAHFSNSTATQYPLLLDFDLARSVFGLSDVAEHVHFEILRRCDESLLRIPFLNNRWSPETESRAKLLGFPTEPRRIDVARNFPWQFYSYRRYRNALVDFCIEAGSAMRDWVPVARLEALKRSPVDPFSSASVKMLFGLVGAIFLPNVHIFALETWNVRVRLNFLETRPVRNSGMFVSMVAGLVSLRFVALFYNGSRRNRAVGVAMFEVFTAAADWRVFVLVAHRE